MPNLKVLDMAGKEVGDISLSDSVFGIEPNAAVLHAAVRAYLMNQRQGTQSALTRTEVSGGGKKPWRQKGTGRARQGSTPRSPVDARRSRVRSQTPQLPRSHQQESPPSSRLRARCRQRLWTAG